MRLRHGKDSERKDMLVLHWSREEATGGGSSAKREKATRTAFLLDTTEIAPPISEYSGVAL